MELSVIVPFVNEYPQVMFTIQNIAQELLGRVDFEIIAVDNASDKVKEQGYEIDKSGEAIKACVRLNPWLKYLQWTKNLSHWQAKRIGVEASSGDYLWFCDAHCIVGRDSLYNMLQFYKRNHLGIKGSIHLPLTYKILESHRLIYKLVTWHIDIKQDIKEDLLGKGIIDYSFTYLRNPDYPFQVPCMSTCGMLISRELYDKIGGWPLELGIYSGGEHFMNFTLGVTGHEKWIYPNDGAVLFHHGENRGYSQNYDDSLRNRLMASYIFGGAEWARLHGRNMKGNQEVISKMCEEVIGKCAPHRNTIKSLNPVHPKEWALSWRDKEFNIKEEAA